MQINSCTQTPNFGRLIITKEAQPALKTSSTKTLEKLNAVGDMLQGTTEYFDLVVGKNLSCKIRGLKDKYFGVFESKVFNNIKQGLNENLLEIDNYTVSRNPVPENSEEIVLNVISKKELYDIENTDHIEELALLTKELDSAAVRHENRSIAERVDRQYARKLEADLLKKFSV